MDNAVHLLQILEERTVRKPGEALFSASHAVRLADDQALITKTSQGEDSTVKFDLVTQSQRLVDALDLWMQRVGTTAEWDRKRWFDGIDLLDPWASLGGRGEDVDQLALAAGVGAPCTWNMSGAQIDNVHCSPTYQVSRSIQVLQPGEPRSKDIELGTPSGFYLHGSVDVRTEELQRVEGIRWTLREGRVRFEIGDLLTYKSRTSLLAEYETKLSAQGSLPRDRRAPMEFESAGAAIVPWRLLNEAASELEVQAVAAHEASTKKGTTDKGAMDRDPTDDH